MFTSLLAARLVGKSLLSNLMVPLIAAAVIAASTVFVIILKNASDAAVNEYENAELLRVSEHREKQFAKLAETNDELRDTEKKLRTEVDSLKKKNSERESQRSNCVLGCIQE